VRLTRAILAFLISPIAYFLVYEAALRFFPDFILLEDMYVIVYSPQLHLFYLVLSIPVFLLARRFHGWTFLSCWLSALLVVIMPQFLSAGWSVDGLLPVYRLWLLSAVAAVAYGGVFWLLTSAGSGRAAVT
jgi:hypothetical protein